MAQLKTDQLHTYNETLSYHLCNLALASEAQPLWESDESKHPDLDDIFSIPRDYYEQLFISSDTSIDDIYTDIHDTIQSQYDCLGAIRIGDFVVADYEEIDQAWTLSEIDSLETIFSMMSSYSQWLTESVSNSVKYSFSRLLMGYALRAKDDSHGIIVLRGTVTTNEWLNNMNYRMMPFHPLDASLGLVHSGFRDVYKGIRGRYRQLVDEFPIEMPLYLVGHSLGAAVSQLAAVDILLKTPERADQLRVYGYATPRTGDPTFTEVYNDLVKTSYRIVNICDVVPYMPFEEMSAVLDQVVSYPYVHTKGELSYVHQAGNPVANHISSYHLATRNKVPAPMDASFPQLLK